MLHRHCYISSSHKIAKSKRDQAAALTHVFRQRVFIVADLICTHAPLFFSFSPSTSILLRLSLSDRHVILGDLTTTCES